jgi:hypothetical protein
MGYFENNIIKTNSNNDFWQKSSKKFQAKSDNSKGSEVSLLTRPIVSISQRLLNASYLQKTRSKAIQPVIKIISKQTGATQLRRLFDYLAREDKSKDQHLSIQTQDKNTNLQNKEDREFLINDWKKDFTSKEKYHKQKWKLDILEELELKRSIINKIPKSKLTNAENQQLEKLTDQIDNQYHFISVKDNKTGKFILKKQSLQIRGVNDAMHILLSVGGSPDEKAATQATQIFLKNNIEANGFKYAFVKHNDTENLHYHIVIKSRSVFGNNLRFDKADLFTLRQEYARELSMNGISRVATMRKDRKEVLEKIKKNIEYIKEDKSWYQSKISSDKEKDKSFNVFNYKSKILKKTQYLIEDTQKQLNNYYGNDKKLLKEDIKYLQSIQKEFKQDLFKQELKNTTLNNILDKSLNSLKKDNNLLIKKLNELSELKSFKKEIINSPISKIKDHKLLESKELIIENKKLQQKNKLSSLGAKERKRRDKYIKILIKGHIEDLKSAKKYLKSSNIDKKYKDIAQNLNKAVKIIDDLLIVSKGIVRGRGISF